MKALSLWQPWASLMLIPDPGHPLGCATHEHRGQRFHERAAKSFETRSWSTNHRGALLIHAAKRWTADQRILCCEEPFHSVLTSAGLSSYPADDETTLPLGAILGYVDLIGCERTHGVARLLPWDAQELAFGDYGAGRFAWECTSPRRFAEPIPYRGAQGLFDVPTEVVRGREVVGVPV